MGFSSAWGIDFEYFHFAYDCDESFNQNFQSILHNITSSYSYFLRKPDCTGKIGLSPEKGIASILRQLAYMIP
ncbi:hypothetical protein VP01_1265g2 [Puccinia sorghi]|uniref:Uncharacterized protein n=1 Tax=Puccinia sorghi TaxID=27349 RepID=A0A0L6VP44_9BASI|nr:hypothetical protein VP01_1265g2 [Puccinia sorghi]